ncbi:MAG TPA: Yip1 family protein [Bryobacteraceae bacterium]|jgi:hypothetical protein|nr:Yip1 family protein [Bryobacteraceae bacterium]
MTPESAPPPEPTEQGMGAFARITGVFFEPGKTFQDIGRRPTFLVPLLVIIAFTIGFTFLMGQHIGWENIARQGMENSSRAAQMTPEQKAQGIAMGAKIGAFMGYAMVVIIPVMYAIMAAVLLGMTAMMSAGLRFKQVYAVVVYSGLPGILYAILGCVVMFLKKPEDFNVNNPLMFNIGAYLDPQTTSKFLYSLATSMDLFTFWMIALVAIGLKAAAGKRLSSGGAFTAVVAPWAVYVLAKSALAGLFS